VAEGLEPDGRRDIDTDFGKKTCQERREDGTLWERVRSWFGYKLRLIVDADHELPGATLLPIPTPASPQRKWLT